MLMLFFIHFDKQQASIDNDHKIPSRVGAVETTEVDVMFAFEIETRCRQSFRYPLFLRFASLMSVW